VLSGDLEAGRAFPEFTVLNIRIRKGALPCENEIRVEQEGFTGR